MSTQLHATLWPEGFDPDDTSCPVSVTLTDRTDDTVDNDRLHSHVTGQLSIALNGVSGLQTETGLWLVPVGCGAWVPPGMPHNGVLAPQAKMLHCLLSPAVSRALPDQPATLMLASLSIELMLALTDRQRSPERRQRIGTVLLDELRDARRLPINYAVMPNHPLLRRIAQECTDPELARLSNAQWAERVAMTERTLARLVTAETGMSFQNWRRRIRLLASLNALARGKSVESVAYDSGYATPTAFINTFKKLFGTTPGQFFNRSRQEK